MFDVTILCKKSTDADTVRKVVSEDNIGFVDVIDNQFFLTHFSKVILKNKYFEYLSDNIKVKKSFYKSSIKKSRTF